VTSDQATFKLSVSEDRMSVALECSVCDGDIAGLAAAVDAELSSMGIESAPALAELKKQIAEAAQNDPHIKGLIVAEGVAPVPPRDASLKWAREFFSPGFAMDEKSGAINYRRRAANLAVKDGELLARTIPPKDGVDGRDVFGKPISIPRARQLAIKAGPGVRFDESDHCFYATNDGRVRLSGNVLAVDYVYTITGNVGMETGDISHPGSVVIQGDMEPLSVIESEGDVEIWGTVEAARIKAGGSITVRDGITGGSADIKAGGSVYAKFILDASMEAGEDIVVEKEIIQSRVRTRGAVLIPAGRIVGGKITALGGIVAGQVGSEGLVPTLLIPGEDYLLETEAAAKKERIEKLDKTIDGIRTQVNPLMSCEKLLTPKQRETATELLASASEMEMEVEDLHARLDEIKADSNGRSVEHAIINGIAYQEARFRLKGRELRIKESTRGPMCVLRERDMPVIRAIEGPRKTIQKNAAGAGRP